MEQLVLTESRVVMLILVVALLAIVTRRSGLPFTVALVVVGALLRLQGSFAVELHPFVIPYLFVPPLVFEAASRLDRDEIVRSLPSILLLAVPGIVITALVVGGLVAVTTPLALPAALVFGALISATDPVAVIALFRTLGAPSRLAAVVEGESLVNDGTAIVLCRVMLAMALAGGFSPGASMVDFLVISAGGTALGLLLGWIGARLIVRVDDHLIGAMLTLALAFGAYVVAEWLHTSGVLAVLAAGLVCGNMIRPSMNPAAHHLLSGFWEVVAALANALVFLLLGLQIDLRLLLAAWQPALWAIVAVMVARVITVYGLGRVADLLGDHIPWRWMHVLTWGGLRGVISLALATSLPAELGPDRDLLRMMTFGVILFTLLLQATTMRPLLQRLGIVAPPEQPLAVVDVALEEAQ